MGPGSNSRRKEREKPIIEWDIQNIELKKKEGNQ